jgi:hypothetical protein
VENKNPPVMTTGKKASLTLSDTAFSLENGYTLCPGNGGSSGADYSVTLLPCSSENHSAHACGQVSTMILFSGPLTLCLLFLFDAFVVCWGYVNKKYGESQG